MNAHDTKYTTFVDGHIYRMDGDLYVAQRPTRRYATLFLRDTGDRPEWILLKVHEWGELVNPTMIFDGGSAPAPSSFSRVGAFDMTRFEWVADSLDELRAQYEREQQAFAAIMAEMGGETA